jgi:predicted O-methyltransferase YrrM
MRLPWRLIDGISTSLTAPETAKLRELAKDALVLEIGSAYGHSAINMAQAGAKLVVAIDPHAGENPDSLDRMVANIAVHGLQDRITIWCAKSAMVLPLLEPRIFDLVFIDGDHSEDAVANDVRHAWRLLKSGGTLAAHDHGEDSCPGVKAALDAWRKPDEVIDTLWIARKP